MKRKRTAKGPKPKKTPAPQNEVVLHKVEEAGTSMSHPPLSKSLSATGENITSTDTMMRPTQADSEIEKNGYPTALSQLIASVIKEISKEAGGLANFSRGLVENRIANGHVAQSHVDMDLHENQSPLHQNQQELNAALTVIKKTMKLDAADPFNRPVDPVALGIPDYFDIIKIPMDFGTICNNLENGIKYTNSADVLKDVEYIWYNCVKYNKKGDYILELMKRVKTFFMKYWTAARLQSELPAVVEPLAQFPNNRAQLQQNEGEVAENQPRMMNMQARQGSSEPQSSSQEQEEEEEEEEPPNIESAVVEKKRHVRGPTRCVKLLKSTERIKIATNEIGQPVGPEAPKLITFLGLTARDGNLAPLTYPSWNKLPKENKEKMWQKVMAKFDIDPCCRSWVLESLRTKWRTFKSYLKATRYDAHETDEERLADRDERVLPDQWSALVEQWSSEKWQSISARNKANRAKLRFTHTSGQKSFARLREEEKAKRDGQEPSRAELFIMTRTRKNGQPVNEETAAIISQLRECATTQNEDGNGSEKRKPEDEVYERIVGVDKRSGGGGRVEVLRMVAQKNAEVLEMKERLATMEQTCSQMAAQMSQMVSMMATLQKASSAQNDLAAADLVPLTADVPQPIPAKKTRGRKKKSAR